MASLVAVPLDGGGVVVVEMDEPPTGGVVKATRPGEVVGQAAASLESALTGIVPAARSVLARLREAGPEEVTVEFGVKLTAEAGAVIARTAGECNLKVTLHWDRDHGVAGEAAP